MWEMGEPEGGEDWKEGETFGEKMAGEELERFGDKGLKGGKADQVGTRRTGASFSSAPPENRLSSWRDKYASEFIAALYRIPMSR